MYIKLTEKCKIFQLHGIYMIGCTITHKLIGLTEAGYKFVQELERGAEVDFESLSKDIKQLYEVMKKNNFFEPKKEENSSKTAYLHITYKCNMKCVGCYSKSNEVQTKNDMSTEKLFQVINKLVEANFRNIIISGGEPFLNKNIIAILKYLKVEKNCTVSCITNGTALEKEYLEALKYLDKLIFSMDGISENTSVLRKRTFDKVDKLIDTLTKKGYPIALIFTLHKQNYFLHNEMAMYAKNRNVKFNYSLFTAEKNEVNNQFILNDEEVLDLFKKLDYQGENVDSSMKVDLSCKECCEAGKTLVSISADGNIYPCQMMHEEKFLMGNAIKNDIDEIVKQTSNTGYISVKDKEDCKSCEYRYLCGGGCMYRAYVMNGSIYKKDQLCDCHKIQIDKILSPYIKK